MIDKYTRLFKGTGMPFLITAIALEHYKPLKAIAIFSNNEWTTYLPKETEEETLKDGLKLYSNKSLFDKYNQRFIDYIKHADSYLNNLVLKKTLLQEELKTAFELISEFWMYYSKTEFFYVDEAFRQSKNDERIAENLKVLEKTKNYGREYMNKMIFGSQSLLSRMLVILSSQFGIKIDDLFWYADDEILSLYNNEFVNSQRLTERRKAYVFLMRENGLDILEGDKAKEFSEMFNIEEEIREIKGMMASPGKVVGKAKVILYGYDKFDRINEFINEMKKGDILIAETTSPELTLACHKASAIITDQGGMLSHAAIISRELNIPCIVGTENATKIFRDGDLVEVDATRGIVRKLN